MRYKNRISGAEAVAIRLYLFVFNNIKKIGCKARRDNAFNQLAHVHVIAEGLRPLGL